MVGDALDQASLEVTLILSSVDYFKEMFIREVSPIYLASLLTNLDTDKLIVNVKK